MEEDGSERHYLEAELEELLATDPRIFSFLRRSSLDGVWYWDLESPENEWMSPEFWELLGFDPGSKKHDPAEWQHLIFEEDRELALENFEKHCADPSKPYDQVVRYRHANGSTVWVRCRGIAIRDDEGVPVRMLGAHNDMTAIKRRKQKIVDLNNELVEQIRKTEAANRDLEHFVHIAAHDLREPCRRQVMLTDLILEDYGHEISGELRSELEKLSGQAQRMLAMIGGFRALTDMAGPAISTSTVHLRGLVEGIVSEADDGLEVELDLPATIEAYESLIAILFRNLIQNACQHGARPPRLRMTHRTEDGRRVFTAANPVDGDGAFDDDRLLQPFVAGKSSSAGSGLGLNICKRIVQRHNGSIWLESADREFSISFTLGSDA